MLTIYSQISAVISTKFVSLFPKFLDFDNYLNNLCSSYNLTVSVEGDQFTVEGDWKGLSDLQNDLLDNLTTMFESSSGINKPEEQIQTSGSFSALVEAAEVLCRDEAMSKDAEFQEVLNDSNSALFSLIKEHDYVAHDQSKAVYPNTEYEHYASTANKFVGSSTSSANDVTTQFGVQDWQTNSTPSSYCDETSASSIVDTSVIEFGDAHSRSDVDSKQTVSKTSKFSCTKCSYSTHVQYYLMDHIRNQHMSITVKCTTCGKTFSNKRLLKQHMKTHENNLRTCETCGKTYKSSSTFKAHLKTHEENYVKVEFDCDQCDKVFSSHYSYISHKNTEHLDGGKSFLCQVCGNTFASKYTLSEHMNLHTGDKPYSCDVCGKCFSSNSVLRDHKNIHESKKLFPCTHPGCGKSFNQRTNLKSHAAIHSDIKAFVCEECNKSFTQKQALLRHKRSHKGIKPFKCRLCAHTFGDISVIRRHLKQVHRRDKNVETWRDDIIQLKIDDKNESPNTDYESNEGNATKAHPGIPTVVNTCNDKKKLPATIVAGAIETTKVNVAEGQQMITIPVFIHDSKNANKQVSFCLPAFQTPSATDVQYHGTVPNFETAFLQKPSQAHLLPVARQEIQEPHPVPQISAPEREHVQFFNENLDGTFTTIDQVMPKVKTAEDIYMKHISSDKLSTETLEQLKPDGTLAENHLGLHDENVPRFADNEALTESLTQFYLTPYYPPYGTQLSGQMQLTPLPGQEMDGTKQ